MHMYTQVRAHTCRHTHRYTQLCVYTHMNTHRHMHTQLHACTHVNTRRHTQSHWHTHSRSLTDLLGVAPGVPVETVMVDSGHAWLEPGTRASSGSVHKWRAVSRRLSDCWLRTGGLTGPLLKAPGGDKACLGREELVDTQACRSPPPVPCLPASGGSSGVTGPSRMVRLCQGPAAGWLRMWGPDWPLRGGGSPPWTGCECARPWA